MVELALATALGAMAGAMLLAVSNQQINFIKLYRTQNFLTDEAPIISAYVGRIIGKAEKFRLHDTVEDALTGQNPRTTASTVAVLNFRMPDGTMRATILSFEDRGAGPQLYYYIVPVSGVMEEPQLAITKQPSRVEFVVDQGILRMFLTGPNGEQIIYSGSMQQ